jgi:hypothetical protein
MQIYNFNYNFLLSLRWCLPEGGRHCDRKVNKNIGMILTLSGKILHLRLN